MSQKKNAEGVKSPMHMHNNEDARIKNLPKKPKEDQKNKWKNASKWLVRFFVFRLISWALKGAWNWFYSNVEKILGEIF